MKRCIQWAVTGVVMLAIVSFAVAQSIPEPVVRIGNRIEIAKDVFLDINASTDIRYRTSQNWDFESEIRDRVASRNRNASTLYAGEGDFLQNESRLGVDMWHRKNFRMRVLFEAQTVMDGNLIDDRNNTTSPGADPSAEGIAASPENNGLHIERFWVDYKFEGTPLRVRVGADLWSTDQAGLLFDDDPRVAVFLDDLGPGIDLYAAAVIQSESARLGLTNDNDFIYYTFGGSYSFAPHKLAVDVAYFRERFNGAVGQANEGQESDTVLVSPSWTGAFGPIRGLVQFSATFGNFQGANNANPALNRQDFDVFGWAAIAHFEANLLGGVIRPFVGVIFGSGDDDPTDNNLNGFMHFPQREIAITEGNGHMNYLTVSPTVGEWGPAAPARAGFAGGNLFRHTTGNVFSDRLGNTAHAGVDSVYSNPGTLLIPVGLHIFPFQGHQLTAYYMYVGMVQPETLEAAAGGVNISNTFYHELMLAYTWTLSPHFDVRAKGFVLLPGDGVKDIAATQTCDNGQACQGEDVALGAELRLRGRF